MEEKVSVAESIVPPGTVAPNSATTAIVPPETSGDVAKSIEDIYAQDAGKGMENLGAGDFGIPFIAILQKGSPQVSRSNAKYIKGAEQGMFYNTLTSATYPGDVGIPFIPCGEQRLFVRWKTRESGGGLICSYLPTDPILSKFKKDDRGRYVPPEPDEIVMDTVYMYGIHLLDQGTPEFAVVSFGSTQLRKVRTWNTVMRQIIMKDSRGRSFNPPTYSHVYRLTSVGEAKDQFDWMGYRIILESRVEDPELYRLARTFSSEVAAGHVNVSLPPQEFEGASDANEEVPF